MLKNSNPIEMKKFCQATVGVAKYNNTDASSCTRLPNIKRKYDQFHPHFLCCQYSYVVSQQKKQNEERRKSKG